MTDNDTEICGFLDVKFLGDKLKTQRPKKRPLTPWKVWRRHWCSAKKLGPGLGIKIELDCGLSSNSNSNNGTLRDKNKSVVIPPDAMICRTRSRSKQFAFGVFPSNDRKPLLYLAGTSEMESQRWMANIRELLKPRKHRFVPGTYNVSLVDNAHAKSSGLSGMYGDLIASATGVFVKDVHSGEIAQNFEWSDFDQFHLISIGRPEDVKCICVMHTTREFRGGIGELHLFCLDATKLLREFTSRGRGPKERFLDRRPLSLSEGDLRFADNDSPEKITRDRLGPIVYPSLSLLEADARHFLTNSEQCLLRRTTQMKMNYYDNGVSSAKEDFTKLAENPYQPEPASVPNISGQSHGRMSAISTGSGIYEEIFDEIDISGAPALTEFVEKPYQEPPPLPPRHRLPSTSSKTTNANESQKSENEDSSSSGNAESVPSSTQTTGKADEKSMDTCNYVPMSPRLKDITLQQLRPHLPMQENDYVIMR